MRGRMVATWQPRSASLSPSPVLGSRPRKRGRDWRFQSRRAKNSSDFWARSFGNGSPRLLLPDEPEPSIKDAFGPLPGVVAEGVFVQVGLQVLGRNAVIHAPYPVLDQGPESVHRACVNVTLDVHLQTV